MRRPSFRPPRHRDNPEPGHRRPSDVRDTDWEAELRRCLAERAGGAPTPRSDLASSVLTRGRRIRRRRNLAGAVAVVVATLSVSGALTEVWGNRSGGSELRPVTEVAVDPDVVASPSPRLAADPHLPGVLGADLLAVGVSGEPVLAGPDGGLTELPELGPVVSAHRTGEGLAVVAGEPGRLRLWWVEPTRPPAALLAGMDAIVVHQGQVAWRRGTSLASAALAGGEITDRVMTSLPEPDIELAGLTGATVVLRQAGPESPGAWDVWHPDRGDYLPTWESRVDWVYGPVGDSGQLLGLAPTDRPGAGDGPGDTCLTWWELDAGPGPEFAPTRTRCLPTELSGTGPGAVSPDGRWLVAGATAGVVLVDLAALVEERPEPDAVTVLTGEVAPTGVPVWLTAEQVVLPADGELVRVWPLRVAAADPAGVERFPLTGPPPVVIRPG